jgi:hypothetical protein
VVEAIRLPIHHAAWVGSFGTDEHSAVPQKNEGLSVNTFGTFALLLSIELKFISVYEKNIEDASI